MPELSPLNIEPVRLGADTPSGFFVSHKPAGTQMLALSWDGQTYALKLTGEFGFRFFPIKAGVSARGALVKNAEFLVELDSVYDAEQIHGALGALIINEGQLYLLAVLMGDAFADPVEVPLWGKVQAETSGEKVGFSKWRIVVGTGDDRVTLFSYDAAATQAT